MTEQKLIRQTSSWASSLAGSFVFHYSLLHSVCYFTHTISHFLLLPFICFNCRIWNRHYIFHAASRISRPVLLCWKHTERPVVSYGPIRSLRRHFQRTTLHRLELQVLYSFGTNPLAVHIHGHCCHPTHCRPYRLLFGRSSPHSRLLPDFGKDRYLGFKFSSLSMYQRVCPLLRRRRIAEESTCKCTDLVFLSNSSLHCIDGRTLLL